MTLLTIDKDKCKQDGFCAADCPAGVIHFKGKGNYPRLTKIAESACLRCGHCVAVCPHGALDHSEVPLAACPPVEKRLEITEAQAVQFLRSRRSIRQFKDQPVEPAAVQRLIEIGRYAPTGANCEQVQWVVIRQKDHLHQIAEQTIAWARNLLATNPESNTIAYLPAFLKLWDQGRDVILRSAPCLVVAMAPDGDRSGMVSISLALSYFELAAPLYGLGTCWAGLVRFAMPSCPDLRRMAGIPENYPHYYPMMVGYSNVKYHRLVERKKPGIVWK